MAIIQSSFFTGVGRPVIPNSDRAGDAIIFRMTHTFLLPVTTADILELFPVPQFESIHHLRVLTANVGAINGTFALMAGTPGDTVQANRTLSATPLINAGALNTSLDAAFADLIAVGRIGDSPVSLGMTPATNITAAANKTLTIECVLF